MRHRGRLSSHKTKIVATLGPACASEAVLARMIEAGMRVARLNLSHGDDASHARLLGSLRAAERAVGRRVTVMADLPGPKIRLGDLSAEPVEVAAGETITLTTGGPAGDPRRIPVAFDGLPAVVRAGDALFVDDGRIELEVRRVAAPDVECRVVVGGALRSRKGLNLPGVDLGVAAFTPFDRDRLGFALGQGVDAVGQSFVESAADVAAVRAAAAELGHRPLVVAKIERRRALERIDEIVEAADGIMIARGDLGVETPIEEIALLQKRLVATAVRAGKPVITATQMLESMIHQRQPTRAEATDVANAILDGTDAVMLSGESAAGRYPVEAVATLARIAAATEPHRVPRAPGRSGLPAPAGDAAPPELLAAAVEAMLERVRPAAVVVPTRSGGTPRGIARLRLPVWIIAPSADAAVCRQLDFSYGVEPVHVPEPAAGWSAFSREWARAHGLAGGLVLLVEGPSREHPEVNHRIEIVDLASAHA